MIKCKICNKEFKNNIGLVSHINHTHNISSQEYYDKYLKQENEGICPICGKPTKFVNISVGYQKTCSNECRIKNKETVKKCKQTKLLRYGDENYNNQDKLKETCLQKYGSTCVLGSTEIREKVKKTNIQRYGTANVFSSNEIKEKIKQTNLKRYGVEYPQQSKEIKAKKDKTNLEKYGSINVLTSKYGKKKSRQTCLDKYGVKNGFQTEQCRKALHKPETILKSYETRISNGNQSGDESYFEELCSIYKIKFERQYQSEKYPFPCDYYIPKLDLYIEINTHWTHGQKWYNNSDKDNLILNMWESKNNDYYNNAINVWSKKDVEKRNIAKKNNIKYITFWYSSDIDIWFDLGNPIGYDWKEEYSWMPERKLVNIETFPKLSDKSKVATKIAKTANFNNFFKQELELWKKPKIRAQIYRNRLKYKNKLPSQLSNTEILSAFKISGILRGYSTFDNKLFKQFLEKHNIKSVYDPCAGWGERLIACATKNIEYLGLDINNEVIKGHKQIIEHYNLKNQKTIHKDSSNYIPKKEYGCLFTCPPYHNLEIYTKNGAENLNYKDFLSWWKQIIKNSNINLVAFQINQKYKDDMSKQLIDLGYKLIDNFDLEIKKSHLTKNKHEYESVVVFRKEEKV